MKNEKKPINRPNIIYDPIRQPKQPIWMRSVEKVTECNIREYFIAVAIIVALAVLLLIFI